MNRQDYARLFVQARENGQVLPWAPVSTGPGTKTFGRDLQGHPESCLILVRGKRYAVAWAVTAPVTDVNVVLAAGVVRGVPTDTNYELAQAAADEAIARIDPERPETYTLTLSDEDQADLDRWGMLDEDTGLR